MAVEGKLCIKHGCILHSSSKQVTVTSGDTCEVLVRYSYLLSANGARTVLSAKTNETPVIQTDIIVAQTLVRPSSTTCVVCLPILADNGNVPNVNPIIAAYSTLRSSAA